MSLVPWRPKNKTTNDLDTWFNFPLFRWPEFSQDTFEGTWAPAIDVVESKKDYRIKADVPGLQKEDLDVSVDGNQLTIKGEKKTESEVEDDGVLRKERSYGSFYRSFTLPQNVNAKDVKATYKNGVLELSIPKREEAVSKSINIDVE